MKSDVKAKFQARAHIMKALALLLAGPALSLPNMLVIGGVMGWKKTVVFSGIIVILSTMAGMIYGSWIG